MQHIVPYIFIYFLFILQNTNLLLIAIKYFFYTCCKNSDFVIYGRKFGSEKVFRKAAKNI